MDLVRGVAVVRQRQAFREAIPSRARLTSIHAHGARALSSAFDFCLQHPVQHPVDVILSHVS